MGSSRPKIGGMAEWSIALVLKTNVPQGTVGSNPTSSANSQVVAWCYTIEIRVYRLSDNPIPAGSNPVLTTRS